MYENPRNYSTYFVYLPCGCRISKRVYEHPRNYNTCFVCSLARLKVYPGGGGKLTYATAPTPLNACVFLI